MLLLSASLAATPALEIPYTRLEGGHIVVQVGVEGAAPVPFVVDTGASVTVLSPETWRLAGGNPDRGLKLRAAGAGGDVQEVRLATGVDVTLAGTSIRVGAVALVPLDLGEGLDIGGLLGRDVLRRYVVEVDDRRSLMVLHPRGAVLPFEGPHAVLPLTRARAGLTTVPVRVGEQEVPAVFDLGAAGTILNLPAATLPGVSIVPECGLAAIGADKATLAVECVKVEHLGFGSLDLPDSQLYLADLPMFATLRLHGAAMILGNDLLKGRRIVLDDARRQVTIGGLDAPTELPTPTPSPTRTPPTDP